MRKILTSLYNRLEVVVALVITAYLVYIRLDGDYVDRVEYFETISGCTGLLLVYLFFVTLPIALIYIISLFRSIKIRTTRQKFIIAVLAINVLIVGISYYSLPRPHPCDASIMEQHYLAHEQNIQNLITYTNSCIQDSCGLSVELRNGKIWQLYYKDKHGLAWFYRKGTKVCTEMDLSHIGVDRAEFDNILQLMHDAGIIGIDIDWNADVSSLTDCYYGGTKYWYEIYPSPAKAEEYRSIMHPQDSDRTVIFYNGTLSFISSSSVISGRGFPDWDTFNPIRHE